MADGTGNYYLVDFDPVLLSIGPLDIRWYSLGYIAGLMFAWWLIRREAGKPGAPLSPQHMDDYLTWATLGVVAGGRLGYVLFYNLPVYLNDPLAILRLWDGGMSFHGGLMGVVLSLYLFCNRNKLDFLRVGDLVALVTPVGLLCGRLANFINGELWGRPTDVPWAMIFKQDPLALPRHPSQLYEAAGEGALLFLLLLFLYYRMGLAKAAPGALAALFFAGYGLARFLVEFVREPDQHLGLMIGLISRGQLLTIPMFIAAGLLLFAALNRRKALKSGVKKTAGQKG